MLDLNNLPDWVEDAATDTQTIVEDILSKLLAGEVVELTDSHPAYYLVSEELHGDGLFLRMDGSDVDFGGDVFWNGGCAICPS